MNINITTVYRNLDKMTENGVLIKSKNPADESCFYQYAQPDQHCREHLHVQCKKCGKLLHLDGDFMRKFNDYIRAEHGFELDFSDSMMIGLCENCRSHQTGATL